MRQRKPSSDSNGSLYHHWSHFNHLSLYFISTNLSFFSCFQLFLRKHHIFQHSAVFPLLHEEHKPFIPIRHLCSSHQQGSDRLKDSKSLCQFTKLSSANFFLSLTLLLSLVLVLNFHFFNLATYGAKYRRSKKQWKSRSTQYKEYLQRYNVWNCLDWFWYINFVIFLKTMLW